MLTEISAILKEKNIDLVAVHGNHDWELKKDDYDKMGVHLLDDSWKELSSESRIAVCGIADSERGNRPWGKISDEFSKYDGFRLVLVHNPDFIYSLPDASSQDGSALPFDYMLSGHLHGGQVHLPGNLEFVFFRKDRIAREEGILGGEYTFRGYKGFISKGTGTGALPIRFMARPEIHILKFHI
jgi:predicted MPP superfamily phosphohydrolase